MPSISGSSTNGCELRVTPFDPPGKLDGANGGQHTVGVQTLEKKPDINTLWQEWKVEPTPARLRTVVDTLKPSMEVALHGVGGANDPYLRSKARTLTAQAIQSYDPASGAQLPTWTMQHLQRLSRLKRQTSTPVRVPERIQLENYALEQVSKRFLDEHDREPDVQELADLAKIPVKRIEQIRQTIKATPSQALYEAADVPIMSDLATDFLPEAVSVVYDDLDHIDRRILEMKTGYGGNSISPPAVVAQKLKLTPSQLSRRAARLSYLIQKAEADLSSI